MKIAYRTIAVGDVELFYREAGPADAPVILLLHGFPTSSHMFRELMPLLASRYRLIAPDLPGFGQTEAPPRGRFDYSFDNLAKVIDGLTQALGLRAYALYVFDYGAPTGFRLAQAHPDRVTAIISQNGNAYLEGLSEAWGPWQTYWREPTPANRDACRVALRPETHPRRPVPNTAASRSVSHPMAIRSTSPTWRARTRPRSSSTLILDYRNNVRPLPGLPALLPRASTAAARSLGKERSLLHPARGRGLPPRHPGRGGPLPGDRPFRARDARGRDRRTDQRVPGSKTAGSRAYPLGELHQSGGGRTGEPLVRQGPCSAARPRCLLPLHRAPR